MPRRERITPLQRDLTDQSWKDFPRPWAIEHHLQPLGDQAGQRNAGPHQGKRQIFALTPPIRPLLTPPSPTPAPKGFTHSQQGNGQRPPIITQSGPNRQDRSKRRRMEGCVDPQEEPCIHPQSVSTLLLRCQGRLRYPACDVLIAQGRDPIAPIPSGLPWLQPTDNPFAASIALCGLHARASQK